MLQFPISDDEVAELHAIRDRLASFSSDLTPEDGSLVLRALELCSIHGLVVPMWAAMRFHELLRRRRMFQADRWDALFGPLYPSGTRRKRAAEREQIKPAIWTAIELREPGRTIEPLLFQEIGRRFGIGGTLCAELYYEHQPEAERLVERHRNELGLSREAYRERMREHQAQIQRLQRELGLVGAPIDLETERKARGLL